MPYAEEVMENGEWSVSLIPETPQSILDAISIKTRALATIVLTEVEVDATDYFSTSSPDLTQAVYLGVYLEQSSDHRTLSGEGMAWWLGEENDGGDMYSGADGTTSSLNLEDQIAARVSPFDNDVQVGLSDPATGTTARTMRYEGGTTRRQFLDTITGIYAGGPYEWQPSMFTGGLRFYVGRRGALWPTTNQPTTILARNGGYGATTGAAKYLTLDGTGDYAETGDAAALDITSDVDIRVRVRASDFSTGSLEILLSKWNTTGNQRSYMFEIDATGEMQLQWSNDGSTVNTSTASGSSLTDGVDYWLRVTLDVNDGGGGKVVTFYKSTDTTNAHEDVAWTTVDTNATAGTTSIFSGTAAARIGSSVNSAGTSEFAGRVYAAAILSGIGDVGTVVADPDFSEWSSGATSKADDAGRTWTLNGNALIAGTESAAVTGLPCDLEVSSIDVRDYRTTVEVDYNDGVSNGIWNNAVPSTWLTWLGNAPVLRSVIDSKPRVPFKDHPRKFSARVGGNRYAAWLIDAAGDATRLAKKAAEAVNTYAQTITATVDVPIVGRYVVCGDTVYAWDHKLGVSDTAYEVEYRGEPAHPAKLRVERLEAGINRGMGVYLRFAEAGPTFSAVNLTKWVDWEDIPATLELGTKKHFSRRPGRPEPINKKRLRRWARFRYKLGRLSF